MRILLISSLSLFLLINLAHAEPRAFLKTESGYLQAQELSIDGKAYQVSNPVTSTYDIEDFALLKESDPQAWKSLENHYRYGVVGTRGLVAGTGAALIVLLIPATRAHPVIPIGLFLSGFIYYMNSRHMAQHNLHKAINQLNGVKDMGLLMTF
ncbi:MAG: hypothetical protein AB7F59_08555 [Bdellovibrionales bacterium]